MQKLPQNGLIPVEDYDTLPSSTSVNRFNGNDYNDLGAH